EKLGPRLVEKSGVQGAINARVATAAMAANEVLARVADVASSDLLDFIHATGRDCFVEHDLGESSGSAVDAARRAGYPWSGQMGRKLSRKVRETRRSNSQKRSERGQEV